MIEIMSMSHKDGLSVKCKYDGMVVRIKYLKGGDVEVVVIGSSSNTYTFEKYTAYRIAADLIPMIWNEFDADRKLRLLGEV